MLLEKNEKVQKELNDYRQKINSLQNESIKNELNRLFMQIVGGIKSIDQQHANFSFGGNAASGLRETREALTTARKKLDKRIKECEQQGLIKE